MIEVLCQDVLVNARSNSNPGGLLIQGKSNYLAYLDFSQTKSKELLEDDEKECLDKVKNAEVDAESRKQNVEAFLQNQRKELAQMLSQIRALGAASPVWNIATKPRFSLRKLPYWGE